jgi:hypothetical protein
MTFVTRNARESNGGDLGGSPGFTDASGGDLHRQIHEWPEPKDANQEV